MRMITGRLVLTASLIVVFLALMTAVALGGGSSWEFEGYHQPGDLVQSGTSVSWSHNPDLGTPDDGPYLVYMTPMDTEHESRPEIPEDGLLVGLVEVHLGRYTNASGESRGPHRAIARFEIPDVPAGTYQITHCNDPCELTLGDVVGGWDLRVRSGQNGRPAEEIASEVRDRISTVPLVFPEKPTRTDGDVSGTSAGTRPALAGGELSPTTQSLDFNTLWLSVVGVVGLLMVVRIVRVQSAWDRQPAGRSSRNESRSRGVSTDK